MKEAPARNRNVIIATSLDHILYLGELQVRNTIMFVGLFLLIASSFVSQSQAFQSSNGLESLMIKDEAIVYVYSYKHIKTLGRVAPPVYLDGKVLAKLDGARFFIVQLEPGTHTFHLKDKKRGGIEMEFKAGEIYYIRVDMREGATVGPAGLVIMPRENGEFDIKQMKPINEGDIKDHERVVTKHKDSAS